MNHHNLDCTDKYSLIFRCGNFVGSVVHSMFLMYLPDGIKVYDSTSWEFEGIWSVSGVESCKIVFVSSTSLVQTLQDASSSHSAQHHRQTDRQT